MEPEGLAQAAQLARGEPLPVDGYLCLDDASVAIAIDGWAGRSGRPAADPVLRDLAARFAGRQLFKTIDLGDDPGVIERIAGDVDAAARSRFGDSGGSYYQLDNASQIAYSAAAGQELFVVDHPRHGTVSMTRLLEELPMARPISTVRLVCAPELLEALRPIAERALASASP
jgi:hypothetical protein